MSEIDYGRRNALESAFGGRAAVQTAYVAQKALVPHVEVFEFPDEQDIVGGPDGERPPVTPPFGDIPDTAIYIVSFTAMVKPAEDPLTPGSQCSIFLELDAEGDGPPQPNQYGMAPGFSVGVTESGWLQLPGAQLSEWQWLQPVPLVVTAWGSASLRVRAASASNDLSVPAPGSKLKSLAVTIMQFAPAG